MPPQLTSFAELQNSTMFRDRVCRCNELRQGPTGREWALNTKCPFKKRVRDTEAHREVTV